MHSTAPTAFAYVLAALTCASVGVLMGVLILRVARLQRSIEAAERETDMLNANRFSWVLRCLSTRVRLRSTQKQLAAIRAEADTAAEDARTLASALARAERELQDWRDRDYERAVAARGDTAPAETAAPADTTETTEDVASVTDLATAQRLVAEYAGRVDGWMYEDTKGEA